ncbi:hypothetical protein EDD16DRAFT_1677647 [Pisolithus croceorrhizus]|nr:hypothetical protein EDD16DRAFT_1677647 [Pisolithus croceorrhizus]
MSVYHGSASAVLVFASSYLCCYDMISSCIAELCFLHGHALRRIVFTWPLLAVLLLSWWKDPTLSRRSQVTRGLARVPPHP